jgi:ABC-type polysaccharide/polyol phosphate transport system ATPase subunit
MISPIASDIVVRVQDVSVLYRVPRERIGTFKEYAIRRLQRRITHEEFWALREVNLDVRSSEVFGIIGRNGAGKSTLLKVIARVLRPTRGRVVVFGNVAPLLEFGAGFHPELSGRENVMLNGVLLGFTEKEMHKKFDRIVEFAELGDFIDAPLRTYSSGMVARLGFAIATDVKPDVLIVDEVLAVGDESFQRKGQARMQEFREQGATILLVTHNMTMVQTMCQRAVWLDHGKVQVVGDAKEVAEQYHQASG